MTKTHEKDYHYHHYYVKDFVNHPIEAGEKEGIKNATWLTGFNWI
jgi:hypothetical protein